MANTNRTSQQNRGKKASAKTTEISAQKKHNAPNGATKKTMTDLPKAEKYYANRDPDNLRNQLIPAILILLSLMIFICLFWRSDNGILGNGIKPFLFGMFSWVAILIPTGALLLGIFWKKMVNGGTLTLKLVCVFICLIMISVLGYLGQCGKELGEFSVGTFWESGKQLRGGGVFGGVIGWGLARLCGIPCTMVLAIAALLLFTMLMIGATPHSIYVYFAYHRKKRLEEERRIAEEEERMARRVKPAVPTYDTAEFEPVIEEPVAAEQPQPRFRKKRRLDPGVEDVDDTPSSTENGKDGISAAAGAENGELPTEPTVRRRTADAAFMGEGVTPMPQEHGESQPCASHTVSETIAPEVLNSGLGEKDAAKTEQEEIDDIMSEENPISEDILRRFIMGTQAQETTEEATVDLTDGLDVERAPVAPQDLPKGEEKPQPVYHFPPITLLDPGVARSNAAASEELQETAAKLVSTLRSFKVPTKIVNVSRGPTITRYELVPEEGVRVRSILNLVDDISLNLATSGVRIEAPIPGKQAVGIEVPNRSVSTVYLRRLIENPQFSQNKSRIAVSLGEDVAGTPIYLDIAKMPHLLIAGATGMGKSVCINSMIVSLLYKATPDEVKLILIDPKKVELSIYNGLPHLLVPVVTEPKKAAGSLQWAVTEMERRFSLIEEVGVRDLASYNKVTADDPDKEFLPQIVIIIDELADLMMTSPDDVEESVCRLAQKARAAGMYLIIGTQRPSVDVITGLIKANIPSRIAFTVASQVDSRTILDIVGAEKLIGRGDMLYAPVGATKPIRVQGAFVDEKEIEHILEFIKKTYGTGEYDENVIKTIEQEAARCGQAGKRGGAAAAEDDGEEDPMLMQAIELAVTSGKISTSLIQRRLSLGYGRAAKLIDAMESRGIVSAPEGQKPRAVLITKQQFMEMALNHDET